MSISGERVYCATCVCASDTGGQSFKAYPPSVRERLTVQLHQTVSCKGSLMMMSSVRFAYRIMVSFLCLQQDAVPAGFCGLFFFLIVAALNA